MDESATRSAARTVGLMPKHSSAVDGAGACAFERAKMIAGSPSAKQVCFDESTFDPKDAGGNFI
jgi:hypothetical protein